MIKKVIASICLFFTIGSFAQEGTASPYSFYGIGDMKFKGNVENRSMGGLNVFPDSTHVNLQNPAGYAGLKLTTLTLGGSYSTTNLESNSGEGKSKRSSIDYLALGLPITKKIAVGVGLMPYTAVGYKIASDGEIDRQYTGTGGVNRAFLGLGYKINESFSVGVNADYNFGEIETTNLEFLDFIEYGSRELNISTIRGVSFNTGVMWNKRITKKLDLFASFMYTPEANLNLSNKRNIATIKRSSMSNPIIIDDVDLDVANTEINLPSKIAFGLGIGETKKWLVGVEYTFVKSNKFSNRFDDIANATFENSSKISVGGYFIPEYNSFSSYMKRVTYRAGFRHENTGLIISGKSINDTALTAGLGFPVAGTFSNINLGVEYGKRGTKAMNLIEENYLNFSLSLSLNDQWFVKRKYN